MAEPEDWTEIVNLLAHELRGPLTSVMGFIELTQAAGPLTERQEYFSERALSSVRQMQRVIDRLVVLGRIEAGSPLNLSACQPEVVAARSLDLVRDQAERREITLQLEIDPNLGTIEADGRQFEQVIVELISNAIKYNRRGGTVWLSARGYDDDVEVSVRDTGSGIGAEDLPHIFERFYRSTVQGGGRAAGIGLGLWLVKAIVEQHGGRVWGDSVLGVGTTFGFRLPRVPSATVTRSEDRTMSREATTISLAEPELLAADYTASSELLDAVDDNLQEPPSIYDDHDDDGDAAAAEL